VKNPFPEIPSNILTCIKNTRNHYIQQLTHELYEYQLKVDIHNMNVKNPDNRLHIITDYETVKYNSEKLLYIFPANTNQIIQKAYRQDIVLMNGKGVVEENMCWPIKYDAIHDKYDEDIPDYPSQRFILNNTEIEINAFPWFHCTLEIYPDAGPVAGLLDLWFLKWFVPRHQPDPLSNVIHRLEKINNDSIKDVFHIDLGTAPACALIELFYLVCKINIRLIRIL